MKFWKSLHPLFIALFPSLIYYAANSADALLSNVYAPIGITLAGTALLWGLLWVIMKNRDKAGVVTSLILLWFFSHTHIQKILWNYIDGKMIFVGYVLVLVLGLVYVFKKGLSKKSVESLAGFLTIVGVYLVVSSIARIVPVEMARAQANLDITVTTDPAISRELEASLEAGPPTKPDIYFIVPDRYGRQDILQEFFDFDNSEFISALEGRGFYVASQSNANYPKTFLSLASSLNLRHLDALPEIVGRDSQDNIPLFQLVQNNEVAKYLKAQGYTFIYSGGWWEPTRVNHLADRNINLYAHSDEFLRKYAQTTVLNPLFNYVFDKGDILGFSDHRVRENQYYQFAELKKVASEPGPKFVMVHMLFPHSPYVLDEKCLPYNSTSDDKDKEEYIAQLQCANAQLLEIIDSIKAQSEEPPVILLQSDEGPFKYDEMNKHGEGVDWLTVSDDAFRHHMGIINAYHVPAWTDTVDEILYPTITPVNSFRLIFNTYFGTEFEKLDDTSFIIPHLNYPYQYIEITDMLGL